MYSWLTIIPGIILIAIAVRDIVSTLFAPTGRGVLSAVLMRRTWRALQPVMRRLPGLRVFAGPITFFVIIASWAVMMILGWALIYWPLFPQDFLVAFGADQPGSTTIIAAIYLSMVTLITLGFGDIVPQSDLLRIAVPLEGLIGFGLLTAGISWGLSIDPALTRRRTLAHHVLLVHEAQIQMGGSTPNWDVHSGGRILENLAFQLMTIRSDLEQFPITYYFRDSAQRASLELALPQMLHLARIVQTRPSSNAQSLQMNGVILEQAVTDFADTLAEVFLGMPGSSPDEIIRAFIADHQSRAVTPEQPQDA